MILKIYIYLHLILSTNNKYEIKLNYVLYKLIQIVKYNKLIY